MIAQYYIVFAFSWCFGAVCNAVSDVAVVWLSFFLVYVARLSEKNNAILNVYHIMHIRKEERVWILGT
jgi:hypothetical protein